MATINPLLRFNPLEPPGPYETTFPDSVTVGYEFAISEEKIVNKLGVYYPQGPSGFIQPVTLKLWSSDGSPVLLLTTSIPAGACSNLVNDFCWISVPETTLSAVPEGTRYVVGAFYPLDQVFRIFLPQ